MNVYKVKKSVLNCKNVDTAIRRATKELMKQEMHENFGDEYVKAIEEKFNIAFDYSEKGKSNMKKLSNFQGWCMNYTKY